MSGARPGVYLAGFDVFLPDAAAHGERLKALAARHGFDGLFPLDNQTPPGLAGAALAQWIYRANVAMIQRADLVMANLNPFRGAEPDSGTAFEVGYAIACGKPVWAYTEQADSLIAQVAVGTADTPARAIDAQGYTVEDFGLNLNLMLACSARVVIGDAADCLARMAAERGTVRGLNGPRVRICVGVGVCVGPFWPDRARRPRYVRRWVAAQPAQSFFQAFRAGGMAPAQPCRRFRTKGRAGARPRPVCSTSCRASSVESVASDIRKNTYMAPPASGASMPGASASVSSARVRASCARSAATVASPCSRAAVAARCTGSKTQELLYSISLARSSVSDAGTTIQPTRHPVMDQALEKLLTEMTRSSGAQCLRKDGADACAGRRAGVRRRRRRESRCHAGGNAAGWARCPRPRWSSPWGCWAS